MGKASVLRISDFRKLKTKARTRDKLNEGKSGTVYGRSGKLWFYFRYMNQRVREPIGLEDTPPTTSSDKKFVEEIQTLAKSTGFDKLIGFGEGK